MPDIIEFQHRYCGVLAPNAKLRKAVIETAGPSGATLQLLTEARDKMGIALQNPPEDKPQERVRQAAARCWAMLLARAPPQMDLDYDQVAQVQEWPDMGQTAGAGDDIWN